MKKLLSLILASALCLGLTVPALAAGKSGDTTVTDTKGNTYTLSNPILYTISREELDQISLATDYFTDEIMAGKDFPLKGITQAYAVPVGTTITAPDGIEFSGFIWVDTKKENGVYRAADSGMGTPIWTSITLDDEEGNTFWILPCYTEGVVVEGNGTSGSSSGDYVSSIAFFTPNTENMKANPFATSTQTNPTTPSKPAFTDVAASAYYADPVAWAVEKGITDGTTETTFSPNNTCTTAQILTFLWRAKGSPEPTSKANTFTDIKESDYYYKAALWAKENGLVSGSTFNGSTPCTPAATVTYLWKLAGSPSAASASFTDVPATAKYSQAVAWAVSKGITSGTSATTFSPDATCTRAQIVTFLYRAYAD